MQSMVIDKNTFTAQVPKYFTIFYQIWYFWYLTINWFLGTDWVSNLFNLQLRKKPIYLTGMKYGRHDCEPF